MHFYVHVEIKTKETRWKNTRRITAIVFQRQTKVTVPVTDSNDDEWGEELQGNPSPLNFLFYCEDTGESIYKDYIVKIAAVLQPLVNNVEIHLVKSFHSLANMSRRIAATGGNNVLEQLPNEADLKS